MKVVVIYNLDPAWDKNEISEARRSNKVLYKALKDEGIETYLEELNDPHLEKILDRYDPYDTIVFNICETLPGIPSSESQVVEIIKSKGFTFTGNAPDVLELSYDKEKVKELLGSIGISVPHGAVLTPGQADEWKIFPAIVKPAREHCSLTITERSVVYNIEALKEQIRIVNDELNQPAMVEDFIDGREFRVSVWNNDPPEVLPLVEMCFASFSDPHKRLCTYESKFVPASEHYRKIESKTLIPLDRKIRKKFEQDALKTYKGLGCLDYARFDFRMRNDEIFFLDFNPNNDISINTSFAMAAELTSLSYGQMLKKIVMMAADRHPVFSEKVLVTG